MNLYGGTPIGYACAFCMKKAIAKYLAIAKEDKVHAAASPPLIEQILGLGGPPLGLNLS